MTDSTPPTSEPASRGERPWLPSWAKIGIVFTMLTGGVAFLLLGSSADEALSYSKLVHEVVDNPQRFQGRRLRVEGDLKQGSVKFREDPCEWRFVLTKKGREMPVKFPRCVVPDTFQDDMGISVVVEGKIQPDGTFVASQVIPRCPSKYEMKQKKKGQKAPHSLPKGGTSGRSPLSGNTVEHTADPR